MTNHIVFKNPKALNPSVVCRIIIHGGQFHADDLLAVLIALMMYGTVQVFRVFKVDESLLEFDDGPVFVVDIGKKYDGKVWFDHHQEIDLYEDGVKPCGASLFAQAVLPSDLYDYFYSRILRPVAVQDNGQAELFAQYPNLLFGWVHSMNPLWDSVDTPDEAFRKAVELGLPIFQQVLATLVSTNKAESVWEKVEELEDGKILVLPQYIPWQEKAVKKENALFVVHPSNRGGFMVQCVPPSMEKWTLQRQSLPAEWTSEGAPAGCTFCHTGRFCASFETQEQAVEALKAIL